jgi:hypothetical protein
MIFTRQTIQNAVKALARVVRTFFSRDPVVATPEVQDERERRCTSCGHFDGLQCSLCTCVVSMKVLLASERCPDRPPSWGQQTRFSTGL